MKRNLSLNYCARSFYNFNIISLSAWSLWKYLYTFFFALHSRERAIISCCCCRFWLSSNRFLWKCDEIKLKGHWHPLNLIIALQISCTELSLSHRIKFFSSFELLLPSAVNESFLKKIASLTHTLLSIASAWLPKNHEEILIKLSHVANHSVSHVMRTMKHCLKG